MHRFRLRCSLHNFVDLNAFERPRLLDMVFYCGESTTYSDHDVVCFDHYVLQLSSNHVLALICVFRLFLKFDYRQKTNQNYKELFYRHDLKELKFAKFCALRFDILFLCLLVDRFLNDFNVIGLIYNNDFLPDGIGRLQL